MNNRILFITICSWSLFAIGDGADNPLVQLVAVRKQITNDERTYRQACYAAYRNGNQPPLRVPSPAELDQERLHKRCVEYLCKNHPEKISAERRQWVPKVVTGMALGGISWLLPMGFAYAIIAADPSALSVKDFIVTIAPSTAYVASLMGVLFFWGHMEKVERFVLNRELENLERQEAVST
jgi:hypothetical protein